MPIMRLVALILVATGLLIFNDRPTTVLTGLVFLLLPLETYRSFWKTFSWRGPLMVFLVVNGLLLLNFIVYGAPITEFLRDWAKVAALISLIPIAYGLGQHLFLNRRQETFLKTAILVMYIFVGLIMAAKMYLPAVQAADWMPEPWERNRASVLLAMAAGTIYIRYAVSLMHRFELDIRLMWITVFAIASWLLLFATASETAEVILILAVLYPLIDLVIRRFFRFVPTLLFFATTLLCLMTVDLVQQVYVDHGNRLLASAVGARLEVWQSATQFMLENDFAPFGVDALRNNSQVIALQPITYWNQPTSHPHNAGLQVLLDLGIVGFVLVLALILYASYHVESEPPDVHFLIVAAIVVAIVSHGAWQSWWLLALALLGLYAGYRKKGGQDEYPLSAASDPLDVHHPMGEPVPSQSNPAAPGPSK